MANRYRAPKPSANWSISRTRLKTAPPFQKVRTGLVGVGVSCLIMGLAAAAVSVIGAAELDEPGDVNARSAGIIGPQHNPPARDLDSQIADRPGVKIRSSARPLPPDPE